MSIRPVVVGLVLWELAIVDEKTRTITTANCFSRRVVEGPLALMPPFFVVVTLVNGHGIMPAKLGIERLDTFDTVYERAFSLHFADSLQELSGIFRVPPQGIPVHGFYQAQMFVAGEVIAQKRFAIVPREVKP